ncbi:hypothetical protein AB0L59_04175 [Streptomyces sp. NPDC052109]|uniref:hypothetical protein n=1 Tax=Streptomyces sp. NPDC052109 TaxID=3155527 RepID=UPI0034179449
MDMALEVVVLPVSGVGFHVGLDGEVLEGVRGLQIPTGTPRPGTYHGPRLCGRLHVRGTRGDGWAVQEYRRPATEPLHRVLAELARQKQ